MADKIKAIKKFTAVTLAAAVTMTATVGGGKINILPNTNVVAHAATENDKEYVSSIVISYSDTYEGAQKELGDEYTVLDKDFNDGMSSHAWIGYSTTDDEDMAITDIKVMNMNGGFNYSDYEELLKSQKEAIREQVDIVVPALIEYAKNYDAGLETAKGVCEALNVYYEDDSEKNLGDFLLEAGRLLVNNSSDEKALSDIEKIFLQGNDSIVSSVENLLVLTQDTKVVKKGSWLTRLSLLGPDGLVAVYKQANPKLSNAKIKSQIKKDYADDAEAILNEISSLQSTFAEYEKTELAKAIEGGNEDAIEEQMTDTLDVSVTTGNDISNADEALEEYVQSTNESADVYEAGNNVIMAGIVEALKTTSYGSDTAYDFFMRDDLTAEDLYPVAYVLSKGQKSIMEDVGLYGVFESILAEDSEDENEAWDMGMEAGSISIYQGVDRSVFTSDTAITGEALKRLSSKGDSLVSEPLLYGTMATGLVVCVIAGIQMVKSSKALAQVLGEGKSLQKALSAPKFAMLAESSAANVIAIDRGFALSVMQKNGWLKGSKFVWSDFMAMSATERYNMYIKAFRSLKPNQQTEILEGMTGDMLAEKSAMYEKATLARAEQAQLSKKLAANRTAAAGAAKRVIASRVLFVLGGVVAVGAAAYEIYNLCSKDNVEFTDIPFNMVDRSYPSGSEEITYIYYKLATTSDDEKADLHNKKGKQWLGVYTTKDSAAGEPIAAASLMVSEDATSANANYEPVALFGEAAGYNLCNKDITGKSVSASYMFFTRDAKSVVQEDLEEADETTEGDTSDVSVTGTAVASSGMIWLVMIIAAIAAIVLGIFTYRRKSGK